MAMANPYITGAVVDAQEFFALSERFQVSSVPKTVVNEGRVEFVGALPERQFLEQVLQALAPAAE